MELDLIGKTALITGASKGIGLAIKKALELEGVICLDVSRTTGYDLLTDDIYEAMILAKDADILINNIGGAGTWKNDKNIQMEKNYGIMQKMTDAFIHKKKKWGRVITISSIFGKERGPNPGFTASKAAQIAYMKSLAGNTYDVMELNYGIMRKITRAFMSKKKKWGRVINIASKIGKEKTYNQQLIDYTAMKHAQVAFIKSVSGHYPGITFNTICPGHIDTGKPMPGFLGKAGKPKDVANTVLFLCSKLSSHINGACITVDGGESHSF